MKLNPGVLIPSHSGNNCLIWAIVVPLVALIQWMYTDDGIAPIVSMDSELLNKTDIGSTDFWIINSIKLLFIFISIKW